MALKPCFECGHPISSRAAACPHCGCPVEQEVIASATSPAAPPSKQVVSVAEQPASSAELPPRIDLEAHAAVLPPIDWRSEPVRPWRRLAARFFDINFVGALIIFAASEFVAGVFGLAAHAAIFGSEFMTNQFLAAIVSVAICVVPIAYITGALGTTPGKFLFGVRVMNPAGRPLGFKGALRRETEVWTEGLGLGVPIVNLVMMAKSRSQLQKAGHSNWDRPDVSIVEYRRVSVWLVLSFIAGIVMLICLLLVLQILSTIAGAA